MTRGLAVRQDSQSTFAAHARATRVRARNRTRNRFLFFAIALPIALAACSGDEKPAPPPTPQPVATPVVDTATPPAQPTPPPLPAGHVRGRLRIIDLNGDPLSGMAPIATLQPNAFDEPIATGPLSGTDGRAAFTFPGDQRVCVRAWDPELNYFANNFVEVLPNTGDVTGEMTIMMARGAALHATLLLPDGAPAANRNIGLMMFHPTRGPWWPSDADADSQGHVFFQTLPPGRFILKFRAETGETIELPDVSLNPADEADLGLVTLQ